LAQSRWILRFAACVALLLVAPGCGEHLQRVLGGTAPPEVQITETRAEAGRPGLTTYRLRWTGRATGGRVDHYLIAIDPLRLDTVDSCWKAIREDQFVLSFSSDELVQARAAGSGRRDFHVFAVRAVSASGEMSLPATRAFFANSVAPTVRILSPIPSPLIPQTVTPSPLITWEGKAYIDPSGFVFVKAPKCKYTIYKRGGPGVNWEAWLVDPDSLRREVAPAFTGWDSTGPDHEWVQYTNLTVGSEYMFVVVAFDSAGDYSPVFDLRTNMLRMYVRDFDTFGPLITLFNSCFSYTYATGGYSQDPSRAIQLQVPGRQPLTLNWTAEPPAGSLMKRYRWALDLENLDDETPRTSQDDWYHWSPWSLTLTSATVGPFAARGLKRESHDFYVEAEDINGGRSLGWVHFVVVHPTFDKDLLIVNDTRFQVDELSTVQPPGRTDSLRAPYGAWPSRAELDTFLFAVGGVPWRMKPTGTLSPSGIFKGYLYDTLGTRYGRENPTIPLDVLNQYRHVIWMTDRASAYSLAPNSSTLPMPTLLYMSAPGRQNTLATWVLQGGELWALGGGLANATNTYWNNAANDLNQIRTYRSDGPRPDLTPGRFMYDLAHWRSEFRVFGPVFVRFSRYDQQDPTVGSPPPAPAWPGGTFTNPEVDYTALPTTLQFRSPATDPLWPYRTSSEFYVGNRTYSPIGVNLEFLCGENRILEQLPAPTETNPDLTVERSMLDSLYLVYGGAYPKQMNQSSAGEGVNAAMTYYHGRDNAPLVFSGMAIWDFRRTDCLALVDFVLGRLWDLPKSTLYTAPSAVAPSLTRRVAVPTPQTFQRPPGSVRQPVGKAIFQRRR
jgi:hypothetical protein